MPPRPPTFLDQAHALLRRKQYSLRTETRYLAWIKRYIMFHGTQHPATIGVPDITALLTHLAVQEQVAASPHNQAVRALLFLYREVLNLELDLSIQAIRAKRPIRLPTVLTKDEVQRLSGAVVYGVKTAI